MYRQPLGLGLTTECVQSLASLGQRATAIARRQVFAAVLLIVASSACLSALFGSENSSKQGLAGVKTSLAERNEEIVALVSKAVVRIETGSTEATTGVIISEDGHVVWPGLAHPMRKLSAVLSTGESVPATNLGWSTEWRVGLLKLNDDREWPHVERGSTASSKSGDPCFEIGYRATEGKEGQFDRLPVTRSGKLTLVSAGHWFITDLTPTTRFGYGAGTFDTDGKLLGISVPGFSVRHHLSTAVEIVTSNWQHLANGKNLDWVRYPPSTESPFRRISSPEVLDRTGFLPRKEVPFWKDVTKPAEIDDESFLTARKVAAATTVRIRLPAQAGRDERGSDWSGVVISPEGHIATCAHCGQLPGDKLMVVLPDSREVPAVALGTNRVSDVALVKITEQGPWKYAELGDSSTIAPDGAVLCAGFPVPHVLPLAPVTTGIYPLQQTPYVGGVAS